MKKITVLFITLFFLAACQSTKDAFTLKKKKNTDLLHFLGILFSILTIIVLIYLNSKNRIFMGDSGTLFLGSIISLIIILNYTKFNLLKVDEIFILMLLPGIDMLRLFIQRIYNRKNPFLGDREHLHHYFLLV